MSANPPILLFDGVCNLCNGFVQFIIRRDPEGVFRFASLQSETGKALLAQYNLDTNALNTVVLIDQGQAYTHSAVALRLLPQLRGFWSWTQIFWLIPRTWRDAAYNWVARNRYRWFGQKDVCMIPTPELQHRFL
ncbi:MAG: hypothetical protein DA408_15150 [Bacteroidetes bacterium]|nr:MAG: hypothetical protein DA408_15150 [Bacteroidota bacterium]